MKRAAAAVASCAPLLLAIVAACSPPPQTDGGADASDDQTSSCPDPYTLPSPDAGCPVRHADQSACMALELGTGTVGSFDNYRALHDGDSVVVTPGLQGLQHIGVALRGSGFNATLPLWDAVVVRADDCVEVGRQRYAFPFVPDPVDPTRLALRAVQLVITDGDSPMADRLEYCTILGRDVVIVVEFDDRNGRRAHREVRVHVDGIDPAARPDIRQAWIDACARRDGGVTDGGDAGAADAGEAGSEGGAMDASARD